MCIHRITAFFKTYFLWSKIITYFFGVEYGFGILSKLDHDVDKISSRGKSIYITM